MTVVSLLKAISSIKLERRKN